MKRNMEEKHVRFCIKNARLATGYGLAMSALTLSWMLETLAIV